VEQTDKACGGVSALREKALVSAALLAITIPVFYGSEALITRHWPESWLTTRWDARIPLVPGAVWIYLSWYLAPCRVLAAPPREFRRVASAIALAFTLCMICYVAFPFSMTRPVVAGDSSSERALRLLYHYDPPWNIFPSFHAALCAVLWRSAAGSPFVRWAITLWMAAICAACVLTKQHNVLDVAAGVFVGLGALGLAGAANRYISRRDRRRFAPAI
jgi:hypothetical protein